MPKYFYTVINLIVLLFISSAAVNIFYSLVRINLQPDIPFSAVVQPGDTATGQHRRTDGNSQAVLARNLFDSNESPASEVGIDEIASLEPTDLKVRLLGTVAGNQESGRAFIMDDVKMSQNIYRQGDTIQNAVLVKIMRGKVVLRVGEKNQMLSMEEDANPSGVERPEPTTSDYGTKRRARTSGRETRTRTSGRETTAPSEDSQKGGNNSISREELQRTYNDFEEMFKQGEVQLNLVDGEADGLVIDRVPEDSFFAKLGLTEGDILHGVNNSPIINQEDALKLYRTMKTSSLINVQLTRNGKKKIITYYLR